MKRVLSVVLFALLLSGCINPAWSTFPEFAQYKREARGKYIGCLGYSLEVPGCEGLLPKIGRADVFIIPGTTDFFQGEDALRWNIRAREFARQHNEWRRKARGE